MPHLHRIDEVPLKGASTNMAKCIHIHNAILFCVAPCCACALMRPLQRGATGDVFRSASHQRLANTRIAPSRICSHRAHACSATPRHMATAAQAWQHACVCTIARSAGPTSRTPPRLPNAPRPLSAMVANTNPRRSSSAVNRSIQPNNTIGRMRSSLPNHNLGNRNRQQSHTHTYACAHTNITPK